MKLIKRGKTYHIVRRVPKCYASVDPRPKVWVSLHTDSISVARAKANTVWAQLIEAWEARLAGDTSDADARFAAAKRIAEVRGFRYLDVNRVAKMPLEDLLQRVEAIPAPGGEPDLLEAAALLGTVPEPKLTVSKALAQSPNQGNPQSHRRRGRQADRRNHPR